MVLVISNIRHARADMTYHPTMTKTTIDTRLLQVMPAILIISVILLFVRVDSYRIMGQNSVYDGVSSSISGKLALTHALSVVTKEFRAQGQSSSSRRSPRAPIATPQRSPWRLYIPRMSPCENDIWPVTITIVDKQKQYCDNCSPVRSGNLIILGASLSRI
jgi:hypothetical protein